ncbi:hypothetical protein Vretifemale_13777 [Volvox reticuliferus]|uniref:Secreted protein n=1 Tax=Volvox reticuliferus TaxID=1737510 RepID=A0A8J4CU14_9CHLO|nr:hypothetical protein Vretifemale_13777 [Volvox reticuliferus]
MIDVGFSALLAPVVTVAVTGPAPPPQTAPDNEPSCTVLGCGADSIVAMVLTVAMSAPAGAGSADPRCFEPDALVRTRGLELVSVQAAAKSLGGGAACGRGEATSGSNGVGPSHAAVDKDRLRRPASGGLDVTIAAGFSPVIDPPSAITMRLAFCDTVPASPVMLASVLSSPMMTS